MVECGESISSCYYFCFSLTETYVINSATLKREAVLEPRNHHLQHVTPLFWTLLVSTLSTRGHQNCTDTAGVLGFVSLAFGQEGLAFPPPAICSKISCRNSAVCSADAPKHRAQWLLCYLGRCGVGRWGQ